MPVSFFNESIGDINYALNRRGSPHNEYSFKTVSWDTDYLEGFSFAHGSNIADSRLKSRDGRELYTLRRKNWEQINSSIGASKLYICNENCSEFSSRYTVLPKVTLRDFLRSPHSSGASYSGIPNINLSNGILDKHILIRFQTIFFPIGDNGKFQFVPESYNYNTNSDLKPKNIFLLCTEHGMSIHMDGKGPKKLFHHSMEKNGEVKKNWLQVDGKRKTVNSSNIHESSKFSENGEDVFYSTELFGIDSSTNRNNKILIIQIPLNENARREPKNEKGTNFGLIIPTRPIYRQNSHKSNDVQYIEKVLLKTDLESKIKSIENRKKKSILNNTFHHNRASNSGLISSGSEAGKFENILLKNAKRRMDECVTVTVVFCQNVIEGIPNQREIFNAIKYMENWYKKYSLERSFNCDVHLNTKNINRNEMVETVQRKTTLRTRNADIQSTCFQKNIQRIIHDISGITYKSYMRSLILNLEAHVFSLLKEVECQKSVKYIIRDKFSCIQECATKRGHGMEKAVEELRLIVLGVMYG